MSNKKTKKRKVISDYRKKIKLLEMQKRRETFLSSPSKNAFTIPENDSVQSIRVKKKNDASNVNISQNRLTSYDKEVLQSQAQLITKDLRKTLLLSIVGFGILLSLYAILPR